MRKFHNTHPKQEASIEVIIMSLQNNLTWIMVGFLCIECAF